MDVMRGSISDREILNAVSTVRTQAQDWYIWAKNKGKYEWLMPTAGKAPMMVRLQADMSKVFAGKRKLRLKVAQVVLGIEGLEIKSFKNLYPAEISALISGFEEVDDFPYILDIIAMEPDNWAKRFETLGTLTRPVVTGQDAWDDDDEDLW